MTVALALAGLCAARIDWSIPPFEDAAMLMRYADHLGDGRGIVWNIGEPPVDGGTDFLFMTSVAGLRYIGVQLETATRLVAVLAHFATVCLIYIGMRRVQRSGIVPAFLSVVYFALGPGLFLAAAYFGTPFFAFAVAVAWLLAQRVILREERQAHDFFYFSLACLVAGLIRPEGVIISILMLAAIGVTVPVNELGKVAVVFGTVFLILGGAYFAWHWSYFGYPLPNPFYVKGSGLLYMSALRTSVRNSAWLLFPFVPAFLLSVRSSVTLRLGVAFSIPIVGSIAMWVLLSDETNFGGRFQYPVLVLGILSWYPLVRSLRDDLRLPTFAALSRSQRLAVVLASSFCLASILNLEFRYPAGIKNVRDSSYDVATMMGQMANRRYTIATTEAGILPLYSKWRAIDTWGLNDKWIAHHGGITSDYLERQHPDMIVFHVDASSSYGRAWSRQTQVLREFADGHHFTLAGAFGISPEDLTYYYVRSDLAERDLIVQFIRSIPYIWDGYKTVDYTGLCPPECSH